MQTVREYCPHFKFLQPVLFSENRAKKADNEGRVTELIEENTHCAICHKFIRMVERNNSHAART